MRVGEGRCSFSACLWYDHLGNLKRSSTSRHWWQTHAYGQQSRRDLSRSLCNGSSFGRLLQSAQSTISDHCTEEAGTERSARTSWVSEPGCSAGHLAWMKRCFVFHWTIVLWFWWSAGQGSFAVLIPHSERCHDWSRFRWQSGSAFPFWGWIWPNRGY